MCGWWSGIVMTLLPQSVDAVAPELVDMHEPASTTQSLHKPNIAGDRVGALVVGVVALRHDPHGGRRRGRLRHWSVPARAVTFRVLAGRGPRRDPRAPRP